MLLFKSSNFWTNFIQVDKYVTKRTDPHCLKFWIHVFQRDEWFKKNWFYIYTTMLFTRSSNRRLNEDFMLFRLFSLLFSLEICEVCTLCNLRCLTKFIEECRHLSFICWVRVIAFFQSVHAAWSLFFNLWNFKERFDNLLLRRNGPGPFCYLSDYNRVVIQHENDIYNQNRTIWFDYNNNVW